MEFNHHIPEDFQKALDEQEQIYVQNCLRAAEYLFLQLDGLLDEFPYVEKVSFDCDFDGGNYFPAILYFDEAGANVNDDDLEAKGEQIVDMWNNTILPGIEKSLEAGNGLEISRSNRQKDRKKFIEKLAKGMPLYDENRKKWVDSFNSFLIRRDLTNIAQDKVDLDHTPARRKPWM